MSQSFERLRVFELALGLVEMVYDVTAKFPREELYGLSSQLKKASTSVVSNVAEGHGRLTTGEWRQFLGHARGSLYEVEAQCIIARRLNFIDDATCAAMRRQVKRTAVALQNFIEFVSSGEAKAGPPQQPVNP